MENRFQCTIEGCNASFKKNSKLTFHLRKHTGERPFACDEPNCTKAYTNSSHLRRHKTTFHGETQPNRIICPHDGCKMIMANKYSLKKHTQRRHNAELYPFQCQECSQGFAKRHQLQQHRYLHTGEAPFACDKCTRGFTARSALNRHLKSHKSYKCESCGKAFDLWTVMCRHRRKCEVVKCELCLKVFSRRNNLKLHKLEVHGDEADKKLFICEWEGCTRKYNYKRNLDYHLKCFHLKEEPTKRFKCSYPKCEVRLASSDGTTASRKSATFKYLSIFLHTFRQENFMNNIHEQKLKIHLATHFKFKKDKATKTRSDKGIQKKVMAEALAGFKVDVLRKRKSTEKSNENATNDIHTKAKLITERVLLDIKKNKLDVKKKIVKSFELNNAEGFDDDVLRDCNNALQDINQTLSDLNGQIP